MPTQHLRSILPRAAVPASVEIVLNPLWGSQKPSHRLSLRAAIQANVGGDAAILDLTRLPKSASHSISISHCKGLGGFAIAPVQFALGFDVEVSARVGHLKSHVLHLSPPRLPNLAQRILGSEGSGV
jgi:hypothetical protein